MIEIPSLTDMSIAGSEDYIIKATEETSCSSDVRQEIKTDADTYSIMSEKTLSILLHVFIMISFEIYFYFNYIIIIEKRLFLKKLGEYFDTINEHYANKYTDEYKDLINETIDQYPTAEHQLYNAYQAAEEEQEQLLDSLLHSSLVMLGIVFVFLFLAFLNCLLVRKQIRWKWILLENILMFVLLGIFEYIFFINVIMQYSPLTDEELRYTVYTNMMSIIDGTY